MNYTADTMLVRSKDTGGTGIIAEVSAEQAGWDYLNMAARRLNKGDQYSGHTGDCEYSHVILGGVCRVRSSRGEYPKVGRRPNVFSGMPWAVYLPRKTNFEIEALTDGFEVATCWVATDRDYPMQLVTPTQSEIELRGGRNASRQINSIMPPGYNCHRIIAVEVYTPGGNWSYTMIRCARGQRARTSGSRSRLSAGSVPKSNSTTSGWHSSYSVTMSSASAT